MTVGSLFAGIGGFDLGFERAGFEIKWQVEIDEYCRRVLERHFPRAERFGDIRECGKHNLKPVDVICGGFPCQDISVAGKRVGIGGERSGLWSEYARIICDLRPHFIVVENVSALLNRGMERVVGDLAAAGYDCEWCVISAADLGAAHLRERVWIVAYPVRDGRNGGGCTQGNIFPSQRPTESAEQFWDRWFYRSGKVGEAVAYAVIEQRNGRSYWTCGWEREPQEAIRDAGRGRGQENGLPIPESLLGRVAYGLPNRVDRLRGLGNAVVPQIAQWIAERIKESVK